MHTYLAFLRGINVGGKSLISMSELKNSLIDHGLKNVRTYIQSGNVIFDSESTDTVKLAADIAAVIDDSFHLNVAVKVFSQNQWKQIIANAPNWWGKEPTWKHNLLIMLETVDMKEVLNEIGELKPGIESLETGQDVLYQSISWDDFSKSRGGKIASLPIYKKMTVRNYNTATKLLGLLVE